MHLDSVLQLPQVPGESWLFRVVLVVGVQRPKEQTPQRTSELHPYWYVEPTTTVTCANDCSRPPQHAQHASAPQAISIIFTFEYRDDDLHVNLRLSTHTTIRSRYNVARPRGSTSLNNLRAIVTPYFCQAWRGTSRTVSCTDMRIRSGDRQSWLLVWSLQTDHSHAELMMATSW